MRWGYSLLFVCAVVAQGPRASFAQNRFPRLEETVETALSRWERASSGLLGVGALENKRMAFEHGGKLSAHEIAVMNDFRGSVTANGLSKRFDWTIESYSTDTTVTLFGQPRDQVEQLFFQSVEVRLDRITGLPVSVRFAQEAGQTSPELAVALSPRVTEPNHFVVPTDAKPIRFASLESPASSIRQVAFTTEDTPAIPADLREILEKWESANRTLIEWKAQIRRESFDLVHHVEERAVGEISRTKQGDFRFQIKPAKIEAGEKSERFEKGTPFELTASSAEEWTASAKTQKPSNGWFAFLSPTSKTFWEQFEINIVHRQPERVVLRIFPKAKPGDQGFQVCDVEIDTHSWMLKTAKLLSANGLHEVWFFVDDVWTERAESHAPRLLPVRNDVPKLKPAPTSLHRLP